MQRALHLVRREWWAPFAAALAVVNVVTGVVVIAAEQNPGSLIGGALFVIGGGLIVAGLVTRPYRLVRGNVLVLAGALWGLPIIWLVIPAMLTVVVWAGVLTSGFNRERAARL